LPYDNFDVVKEEIESVSPMVDHVSVYMLQVEEGTPLKKMIDDGKMSVPDEDTQVDLFEHACRVLSEQGFERYEVSNFSKNGRQSNHNVGYWTREEYLGLGLNASGLIFDTKTGAQKRIKNTENLEKYLLDARNCATYLDFDREENLLSEDEIFEEKIMLGLRLNTGVDKSLLGQNRLNILLSKFGKYVVDKGDKVALTGEGMDIMNRILVEILD
jgi:oxygen-independent coproporphyrinogen-3 oxidase